MASTTQERIVDNVTDKVANLPIQLDDDLSIDYVKCLEDAMRDMSISDVSLIVQGSKQELMLELKTVRYAMFRMRNFVARNFKYSTGNEGKSIDKNQIFKSIDSIISSIDEDFSKLGGTPSTNWTKPLRDKERLGDY